MERGLTDTLRAVLILIIFSSTSFSENDLDWNFCGTWLHGTDSLSLTINLSTGCSGVSVSANGNSLSITGQITAQCRRSDEISLNQFGLDSARKSNFCLYWEPLLDQLKLEIGGRNLTLCWPGSVQGSCCTDLSPHGANTPEATYGIFNGMVRNDSLAQKTQTAYTFRAESTDCKALCDQMMQGSTQVHMIKHPCARNFEVEMKGNFRGANVTSPTFQGVTAKTNISVLIPPALKPAAHKTSKVDCNFYKTNSLFQDGLKEARVLDDVVEITVENEIIANLTEPIKIGFHHDVIPKNHSRKCVSWDTKKDPWQVNWSEDGCETHWQGEEHTECHCNHLTYFSILVQLKPRPVCHLVALTAITSLGCAVSVFSCVALIVFFCRKSWKPKEQSIPIHLGLAVSLGFLHLLFFLTGVLANVPGERVCSWVGAGLHYTLISSLMWMGIEIFHTFWLVYVVFTPSPKPYVWNLIGFILPAVPVVILFAVGDIYGKREVHSCEEPSIPHSMCWMKVTPKALLAHYFTNMTILVVLVTSGIVMLFLVYRQIRSRDEWRQNRVAFLSIWGLSCLFGTTWGLTFLDFGPLSDFVTFISCILNSFQGFFMMLRFYMLNWIRKQAGGSGLGSSSTGSTRQHMLQAQEKN